MGPIGPIFPRPVNLTDSLNSNKNFIDALERQPLNF